MRVTIPPESSGREFKRVLTDYNGVLAVDGILLEAAAQRLRLLGEQMEIHVVTADTFGTVRSQLEGFPVNLHVLGSGIPQDEEKLRLLRELGADTTVAMGNGRNDLLMLKEAALGIFVLGREGGCLSSLLASDVVVTSVEDALDLMLHPKRLVATLRN